MIKNSFQSFVSSVKGGIVERPSTTNIVVPKPWTPLDIQSKLAAWYDFTDGSTVSSTEVLDKSGNNNTATRTGSLVWESSNVLAGGKPALVWPATGTSHGLQLPGLTIEQVMVVCAYDDGIDATFDTFATLLSGVSGTSGAPRILGNSAGGGWVGSSVITPFSNVEGELTNTGERNFKQNGILPLPLRVLNFRFPSGALTETSWKWGSDNSSTSRQWNGPQCEVILFNDLLTQDEQAQVYAYFNKKYSKELPLPSMAMRDYGKIIDKPVGMPTAGPYYPTIVNMSDIANFPFDWAIYFSTDHDANDGGIWLYVANGDPTVAANWKSYDQAVLDGDFDYLSSKPSVNPIYVDTVQGKQTETPRCQIINGTLVMTYQNDGQTNGQATLRAKSTDGVNFIRDGVVCSYSVGGLTGPGGDHTGYFDWGRNPFPDVPYDWVGYGLSSDGLSGYTAQWGTNDPVNGQWTLIAIMQKLRGRALGQVNSGLIYKVTQTCVDGVRNLGNGIFAMPVVIGEASAGGGIVSNRIFECYYDSTGRNVVRTPRLLVGLGASGTFNDNYVAQPSMEKWGRKDVMVYGANDGTTHSVGIAVREAFIKPSLTELSPVIPTSGLTEFTIDLANETSLPSWLEIVKVGTTTPTESFTSTGLQLTTTTGSTNGQSYIYFKDGILPSSVSYIEIIFDKVRTVGNSSRTINFGFANSKNVIGSVTDALYCNNVSSGGSVGGQTRRRSRVASTDTTSDLLHDMGNNSNDARGAKRLGMRWFVTQNQHFVTAENGDEITAAFTPSLSTASLVYPFIGVQSASGSSTEEVRTITIRYG